MRALLASALIACSILQQGSLYSGSLKRAESDYSLGRRLYESGRYGLARECFLRAASAFAGYGRVRESVRAANSAAACEIELGQYKAAHERLIDAIKIAELIGERKLESELFSNLGKLYALLGSSSDAIECMLRALKIDEQLGERSYVLIDLINIGAILGNANRHDEAIGYYQRALHGAKKLQKPNLLSTALYNLGTAYAALDRYSDALESYNEALKLDELRGWLYGVSRDLHSIGYVHMELGNYREALAYFDRSMSEAERIGHRYLQALNLLDAGRTYYLMRDYDNALSCYARALRLEADMQNADLRWHAEHGMGQVHLALGLERRALDYYLRAMATIDELYSQLRDDRFQIVYFEDKGMVFESAIEACYRLGRHREAFLAAERARARNLLQFIGRGWQLAQVKNVRTLERWDARSSPRPFKIEEELALIDVDALQRVIGKDEALIEYFAGKEALYAFIVKRDGLAIRKLGCPGAELERMVSGFRLSLEDLKRTRNLAEALIDLRALHLIYRQAFEPLEDALEGVKGLILVPDGALCYLPFEALVVSRRAERGRGLTFSRYDEVKFLIERYAIRYAPSAKVLIKLARQPTKEDGFQGDLLAFANPSLPSEGASIPSRKMQQLRPLPYAAIAVEKFRKYFRAPRVLVGEDASESNFRKLSAAYKVLHLGAHAIASEADPMSSVIMLVAEGDDGLYAYELMRQPIAAELVTLSACETGLGRLTRGEGLIALSRAFMCAGARSVLATLWSIEDRSDELLVRFYQHLSQGKSKSEAMRSAKLELIGRRKMGGRHLANPFIWAPFILIGDDRPIFQRVDGAPEALLVAVAAVALALAYLRWRIRGVKAKNAITMA